MTGALASFPDHARVWVFGADRPIVGAAAERLLAETEQFVARWGAHGAPLRAAYAWHEDRFLTVAVDPTDAQASGCSIDGLFRTLQRLESELGVAMVGGGRVFYRGPVGGIVVIARDEVRGAVSAGEIGDDTMVFDPSVVTLGDWRSRFEMPARASWVGRYL